MAAFVLVVLCLCVPRILCDIQRNGNIVTERFENPAAGYALVGHTVATHVVASRIDCAFECIGHPRCLSYNYEEGDASRNQCELNDQTRASRPQGYQSRLGSAYYETDATKEVAPYFTAEFPTDQKLAFVQTTLPQTLTEFTICLWLKIQKNDFHVFTYATEEKLTALAVTIKPGGVFRLYINNLQPKKTYVAPLLDNKWHHTCQTWETANGTHRIYLDGVLKRDKGGLAVGERVQGGGVFIIGQKQETLGGSFKEDARFSGSMNNFNVWDVAFDGHLLTRMFVECVTEYWAVVSWADMRQRIGENLTVVEESPCILNDRAPAADFQLDFFNASVHDYVEYRELMPELSSFTVCMWLRLGDDYAPTAASLFSYAVGNQTRALMALLIADNTVLLTVNNASWISVSFDFSGVDWHHLCWAWNNDIGLYKVYCNRKKVAMGSGYKAGDVIAANGIFILGQEQGEGGVMNTSRSFQGKISHLNIWSSYFDINVIRALNIGCDNVDGNALPWSALGRFKSRVGKLGRVKPATCLLPGYTAHMKRHQYCQDLWDDSKIGCARPILALFDRNEQTSAKRWRCYSSSALKEFHVTGSFLEYYDDQLLSECTMRVNTGDITDIWS